MSEKPTGTSGKKAKSTTAVRRVKVSRQARDQIRKERAAKRVLNMKVPRGTERARRRDGISADWRSNNGAKQMPPAKIPLVILESSHSTTMVRDVIEAERKAVMAEIRAMITPEAVLEKRHATKVLAKPTKAPRKPHAARVEA